MCFEVTVDTDVLRTHYTFCVLFTYVAERTNFLAKNILRSDNGVHKINRKNEVNYARLTLLLIDINTIELMNDYTCQNLI